uniref:Uncharacterized protein n=1 Tax=Anguilla anguilla TaxID=7936 RepID=A0A0E9S9V5_ANGAN
MHKRYCPQLMHSQPVLFNNSEYVHVPKALCVH